MIDLISALTLQAAQTATASAASNVVSYDASFFVGAAPTSAKQMVARLPGFVFSGGQAVRGFGGAAGNVLINGQRPTSKTDTLDEILDRIPAGKVTRIDVVRGGAPGLDMQGLPMVANVILDIAASTTMTGALGVKVFADGRVTPVVQADIARRAGERAIEATLQVFGDESSNAGHGRQALISPSGQVIAAGDIKIAYPTSGALLRAAAQTPWAGGLLRGNVRAGYDRYDSTEINSLIETLGGAVRRDATIQHGRTPSGEIGGDYVRRLGATEVRVLALQSLKRSQYDSETRVGGAESVFGQRNLSGETIGRATADYRRSSNLGLAAGLEGAYNFLDGASRYAINGVAVAIPSANVKVEEARAEAFGRLDWRPSLKASVEAEVRYEVSKISQSGDTDRASNFAFLKPRVLLSYAPSPLSQLRLRVEREVGQLNFTDFVSSANFTTGDGVNAGNADLSPEQRWVVEGVVERRFWGRGAITLTANHSELHDVIDQIPLGGFSAPGNIGDGRRDSVSIGVTLPLGFMGMPGGLLKTEPKWTRSKVIDPTTALARRISSEQEVSGTLALSNDMPRLKSTWQFDLYAPQRVTAFRTNQILRNSQEIWLNILWDYKPAPNLSVLIELHNFTSRGRGRDRLTFAGLRAPGAAYSQDSTDLTWGPYLYVRVRKQW